MIWKVTKIVRNETKLNFWFYRILTVQITHSTLGRQQRINLCFLGIKRRTSTYFLGCGFCYFSSFCRYRWQLQNSWKRREKSDFNLCSVVTKMKCNINPTLKSKFSLIVLFVCFVDMHTVAAKKKWSGRDHLFCKTFLVLLSTQFLKRFFFLQTNVHSII